MEMSTAKFAPRIRSALRTMRPSQKGKTSGAKADGQDLEDDVGGEMEQKWKQLLKPIRDLAESWKVDISRELDEYMEDVAGLLVEDIAKLDFRKAGILVQISSHIYGKKVESLAKYFQQFFTDVANQKSKRKHADADEGEDNDGRIDHDDVEWKSLDDISGGTGIDLEEEDPQERELIRKLLPLSQVPAVLLAKMDAREGWLTRDLHTRAGEAIGKPQDFMMNAGTVHSTGALLIDHDDELILERILNPSFSGLPQFFDEPAPPIDHDVDEYGAATEPEGGVGLSHHPDGPDDVFFAANVSEDNDADMPDAAGPPDDHFRDASPGPDNAGEMGHDADGDWGHGDAGFLNQDHPDGGDDRGAITNEELDTEIVGPDPWAMLDPHDVSGNVIKHFRKGKIRNPLLQKKRIKGKTGEGAQEAAKEAKGNVLQFLKTLNAQQASRRSLPQGPLKSLYWEEFGYIYAEELNRRKERQREFALEFQAQAAKTAEGAAANAGESLVTVATPWDVAPVPDDDYDDDYDPPMVFGDHDPDEGPADPLMRPDPFAAIDAWMPDDDFGAREQDFDLGGAMSAGLLAGPLPNSYEDLCKKYVEDYLHRAELFSQDKESSMAKRVRSWEDKLKPILEAQDRRGYCNIQQYGVTIMQRLEQSKAKPGTVFSFDKVAGKQEPYEVCRLFLATLHLANAGNVEICGNARAETDKAGSVGELRLKLLSTAVGDLE